MAALEITPDLTDGTVSPEKRRDVTALFKLGKRMIREGDKEKRERLKAQYYAAVDEVKAKHGPDLWT
jgi:hypothetical protein